MYRFEQDVLDYLGLPSMPRKKWDGASHFDKGVAVVEDRYGDKYCAACSFVDGRDYDKPVITKVFGIEPFVRIVDIYTVPDYMSVASEVPDMDLDAESKKRAEEILEEAAEMSAEVEAGEADGELKQLPEWIFPEITNKAEAEAWLRRYRSVNHIRGRIPTDEEAIKLSLYSIFQDNKKYSR